MTWDRLQRHHTGKNLLLFTNLSFPEWEPPTVQWMCRKINPTIPFSRWDKQPSVLFTWLFWRPCISKFTTQNIAHKKIFLPSKSNWCGTQTASPSQLDSVQSNSIPWTDYIQEQILVFIVMVAGAFLSWIPVTAVSSLFIWLKYVLSARDDGLPFVTGS